MYENHAHDIDRIHASVLLGGIPIRDIELINCNSRSYEEANELINRFAWNLVRYLF